MRTNKIRLTESQLNKVIKKSVKKVLSEKYDPFAQGVDDNGDICYPRYEKDTAKYRANLPKQAKHLVKQIEFFIRTLAHAYPSRKKGVANYREELESTLMLAIYGLEDIFKPSYKVNYY